MYINPDSLNLEKNCMHKTVLTMITGFLAKTSKYLILIKKDGSLND